MTLRRHRILSTVGLLAAVLFAVFMARASLLEAVLKAYLAQSGDGSPELEVLHVGLSESTIANVKTKWLRAARVTARYGPTDLLNARVALLEVDGLALDLDLTARAAGGAFQLPSIPPIALSEAVISAKTPMGPVTISAEGRTEPVGGSELRGDLDIRGSSGFGEFDGRLSAVVGAEGLRLLALNLDAPSPRLDGMALGQTTLDIALREARWSVRASTQTADARAKIALRGSASGTEPLRDIAIELDARIDGKAGLLRDLMPAPPVLEDVRLGLSMTASGPMPDALPSSPGAWVTALASMGLSGEATVDIVGLHHPASRRPVSVGMGVTVAAESDGLIVTMPDKILVSAIASPDPPADSGDPAFDWQQ